MDSDIFENRRVKKFLPKLGTGTKEGASIDWVRRVEEKEKCKGKRERPRKSDEDSDPPGNF